MRSPRRIVLAAVTSAGILMALAGLATVTRGLTPGKMVDDTVEIPSGLVGAIAIFTVLVTLFSIVREAELRRVAQAAVLLGAGPGPSLRSEATPEHETTRSQRGLRLLPGALERP